MYVYIYIYMYVYICIYTAMSVGHFIDGFLGLTDYRRLKIGQMFFNLKIFFWYGLFFFVPLSLY